MKLPKNRTNIFVVVRETLGQYCVLDCFSTYEGASNRAYQYQQEFEDRDIFNFTFHVKVSTYYDA
jgi:hypothetical protein